MISKQLPNFCVYKTSESVKDLLDTEPYVEQEMRATYFVNSNHHGVEMVGD